MESVRVGCVGVGQDISPPGADGHRGAVVYGGGGVQADAGVPVDGVVVGEELLAERAASASEPKRSGKTGQYFRVLKFASEYGLSLDTRGRECERTMFR